MKVIAEVETYGFSNARIMHEVILINENQNKDDEDWGMIFIEGIVWSDRLYCHAITE